MKDTFGQAFGGAVGVLMFVGGMVAVVPDLKDEGDGVVEVALIVSACIFLALLLKDVPDPSKCSGRFRGFCARVGKWVFAASATVAGLVGLCLGLYILSDRPLGVSSGGGDRRKVGRLPKSASL